MDTHKYEPTNFWLREAITDISVRAQYWKIKPPRFLTHCASINTYVRNAWLKMSVRCFLRACETMMNAPKCNWRGLLPSLVYKLGKSRFAYVWKSASSELYLKILMRHFTHELWMARKWLYPSYTAVRWWNGWLLVPSKVNSNWLRIKQSVQPGNIFLPTPALLPLMLI